MDEEIKVEGQGIEEEKIQEELPVEFLTQFVRDGWDQVGLLKSELEAIKKEFIGTEKMEGIIQDLIDAYLIGLGRTEAFLHNEDYLELPSEEKLAEVEEKHKEEKQEEPHEEEIKIEEPKIEDEPKVEDEIEEDKSEFDMFEEEHCHGDDCKEDGSKEDFEYFVDFDEPSPEVDEDDIKKELEK